MPFDPTNTEFMQQKPMLPFNYMYDIQKICFHDDPRMSWTNL